ncbi:ATP-binding protein [Arthrobacter sp. EH-1B-1]|uniref:ATP-binding protein n=1 Tax=Arthrobacter vasquezii TaxID=2977629 RepID=A0ABT6CXB3_9MICC|nr:ATP-binding protein [Arthrobacter vasquezii]MDF9278431.1 ATP-binding protein [Arthrobacter vasquezii]
MTSNSELFGNVLEYPDPSAQQRFNALVGIDHIKRRLVNEASVLIDPQVLEQWSAKHHGSTLDAVRAVEERTPLIVLAGDVGTGKTELAESVGDPIARSLRLPMLTLYPLSLNARGRGLVGEMTTLITQAFEHVRSSLGQARDSEGQIRNAAILLIDEADAIAQSRELAQMHHEDRAGVNALIRAIDSLRRDRLPVLTIMCTNRSDALDPAIARRAAHVFAFTRPTTEQRVHVLTSALTGTRISAKAIEEAARLLGAGDERQWSVTYSDLRQRFVPDLVLNAYGSDTPVTEFALIEAAASFVPTRPFGKIDV